MVSRKELLAAYNKSLNPPVHLKHELSYTQMLRLAVQFDEWAMDPSNPKQSSSLMGLAEGLRTMAHMVGPDWNPPPVDPKELSIVGAMARLLDEHFRKLARDKRRGAVP